MFLKISVAFAFIMAAVAFFVAPTTWKKEQLAVQKQDQDTIPSESEIDSFSLGELQAADERLNHYYTQHDLLKKLGEGETEEMYRLLAAKSQVQQRIEELKKTTDGK